MNLGYKITFKKESWKLSKGAMIIVHGKHDGSLYIANGKIEALLASAGQE